LRDKAFPFIEDFGMKSNALKKKKTHGFTLIEAVFATMLLGLVIAALAAASGAFTMANGYGVDLSPAEFLIEEIREKTANVDVDTLLSTYDGQTYSPPIALSGAAMTDFSGFTQQINIEHVQSGNFDQVDGSGTSDFVRVTVAVTKNGKTIAETSWIRARLSE